MNPPLSKLVFKAGCAALALCVLGGDLALAQSTNGIPIVHRKHRYAGRVQLLGGAAADLPPPPPSEEDLLIEEQNESKQMGDVKAKQEALSTKDAFKKTKMPPRRPDPRKVQEDKEKEQEKNPFKSLFITDSSVTNKADPQMKKFGWLAEETDLSRQRMEALRKPAEEESWTNSVAGGKTNETKRVEAGSLKAYAFEPLGGARSTTTGGATTTSVARVVEDQTTRDMEKRKQDDLKDKAHQKERVNIADKNAPTLLTATNETFGLSRSRKDEEVSPTAIMDNDFSQTRKAMAEITSRYQLGLNIADVMRRPTTPAPETTVAKAGATATVRERDGGAGRLGETRRPAGLGESEAGATVAITPPAPPPGMGATAWNKPPAGRAPPPVSASTMVEGSKMPKLGDSSMNNRFVAPPPPASTPVTVPAMPAYTPGSITPSFSPANRTPGAYTPSSLTPSFKPTTPYKSPFDTTPSR